MPDYFVTGWALEDFSGVFGDPANNTNTTPDFAVGTSTTLAAGAAQIGFQITDDDPDLEDAYIETGALSVLTHDIVIGGVTYNAGQNIESEFQLVTDDVPPITFIIARIGTGTSNSGNNLIVFTTAPINPGQTYTFASGGDGPVDPYTTICFASGTGIETPGGTQAVEDLARGDLVVTRDAGAQPIRWIGRREVTALDLCRGPDLRPIRIAKGALGPGSPARDLVVSPQHRLKVSSAQAGLLFGCDEVLAPAKALTHLPGIAVIEDCQTVTYHHILLDDHHLIRANGHWAETLLPGDEALATMPRSQRAEIEALFPDLLENPRETALPTLKPWEAALLAAAV